MRPVAVNGKHLEVAGHPFRVKGVTYGGFTTRLDGYQFPESSQLKRDLVAIAAAGFNTVRTYTLPPEEAFEVAAEVGLRFLVGVYYDDWRMELSPGRSASRRILDAGRRAVSEAMERCAGNPNVLAVAVGNEVPVDLVRLHGPEEVTEALAALIDEVHDADPGMLATYVNFPTTEFLEVPGQDLATFNVFLEQPDQLRRYLSHLQVTVGSKPLVITELGLAGDIHGEAAQAEALAWQLRTVDESGSAGATVFSWTDEWAVDDEAVTGWGFGLVREDRSPKPALEVASQWAQSSISDLRDAWPRMSVVVCAYNEEATIEECLSSLAACRYPDLEVIVCDDGSTDRTLEIARRFPFKVLELDHGGLSRARNAGLAAATGEYVAYLDADAACHPEWPYHLALSFESRVAVTGGPNLPHPDAGFVERAVGQAPGQPMEVLLGPNRAEHVPGCNMAFRKEALERIGGFDPVYTSAGDDVDVCWKLLDEGEEIGFAAAAQVIHHRRNTIGGYLSQQRGYGRAEKMLSGPHRHRFNLIGQARWLGFLYGGTRVLPSLFKPVVYSGWAGLAPFQPITRRRSEAAAAWMTAYLPLALPLGLVAVPLAMLSLWWLLVPALLLASAVVYGVAVAAALEVDRDEPAPLRLRAMAGALHIAQPLARFWGRLRGRPAGPPLAQTLPWNGNRIDWLGNLSIALHSEGCSTRLSPPGRDWDVRVICGPLMVGYVTTAVAWHWQSGYRVRYRPRALVVALVGASLVSLPFWGMWALAPAAFFSLLGLLELTLLRRRVLTAIERTTHPTES